MRVTMKKLCALDTGVLHDGKTYDVPKRLADQLFADQAAVPADEDPAEETPRRIARRAASKDDGGE